MPNNEHKLRSKPLSLGSYKFNKKIRVVTDLNQKIEIPAFTTTLPSWPGASYIVARIIVQMGFLWSFRIPVVKPTVTFVPCIKWVESGTIVRRYKLWEDVGELLGYPLYTGELIPAADVILEFWSIEDELTVALTEDEWQPLITLLESPDCCCDETSTITVLDAACLTHEPPIADNYLNNLDDYFEHCPLP